MSKAIAGSITLVSILIISISHNWLHSHDALEGPATGGAVEVSNHTKGYPYLAPVLRKAYICFITAAIDHRSRRSDAVRQ
jgi:hypothetical protein